MPDPKDKPYTPPPGYREVYLPNYKVALSVPANYTDEQIDAIVAKNKATILAGSPARQKANAALATAAAGVGLPTTQNANGQTVLPPSVLAQGIPNAVQANQQAQKAADNKALLDSALQYSRHPNPLMAVNSLTPQAVQSPVLSQRLAQYGQQQAAAAGPRQAILDRQYPNSLVGSVAAALGAGDGNFDQTLAQQTGWKGGAQKLAAGLLNSAPLLAGAALAPEEISPLLSRVFLAQMAAGTAESAANSEMRQNDPGQYWTTLLGNAALTGLAGAHEVNGIRSGLGEEPALEAPQTPTPLPDPTPAPIAVTGEEVPQAVTGSLVNSGVDGHAAAPGDLAASDVASAPSDPQTPPQALQHALAQIDAIRDLHANPKNRATAAGQQAYQDAFSSLQNSLQEMGVPLRDMTTPDDIADVAEQLRPHLEPFRPQDTPAPTNAPPVEAPLDTSRAPASSAVPVDTPEPAASAPISDADLTPAQRKQQARAQKQAAPMSAPEPETLYKPAGDMQNAQTDGNPPNPVDAPQSRPDVTGMLQSSAGTDTVSNTTLDKAANINLDRLNTSDDVKAAIRDAVRQRAADIDQARGGTIPLDQTAETARQLGLTPKQVRQITPGATAAEHVALRQLLVDSTTKLKTAQEAYSANPTDETQAALQLQSAEHQTLLAHVSGHAAEAGRTLSAYRVLSDAFRGQDKPTGEAAPMPVDVEKVFKPEAAPRSVDPSSSTYGSRNKLVSQADAQAARARLLQNLGNANTAFDPRLLGDVAKLGLFHLEAGLRAFPAWAAQMRQEVPGLSEGDLQDTWANLRAVAQKQQQTRVQSSVFVDQLGQRLGRQGAASFVEALRDEHGSTELLDKLVTEHDLTPEEKQTVANAYLDHQPQRATPKQTTGALATVQQIAAEARAERATAAKQAARANKPAPTAQELFEQRLVRTYGRKGADTFLQQVPAEVVNKMLGGKELTAEERQSVADAHLAVQRPKATPAALDQASQTLKEIVQESRKQAAAQAKTPNAPQTPADIAKRLLLADSKADADRIAAKIGALDPNDTAGLNRVMREESNLPLSKQVLDARKIGLISSPRTIAKILTSHGIALTADELAKYPAAVVDALIAKKTGVRTVQAPNAGDIVQAAKIGATQGVKEGAQILKQSEAEAVRNGMQPIGHSGSELFGDIHTRSPLADAYLNSVLRAHSAAYRPLRLVAFTRAIQEQARLTVTNEGLQGPAAEARVKDLIDNPPADHVLNAVQAAEQAMFLNQNKTTKALTAVKQAIGPTGAQAVDFVMPFPKISSNLVGRLLEHVAGVPVEAIKQASRTRQGLPFTPDEQARFTQTFGRNAVGVGAMALGYTLAHSGALTGFGKGEREYDGGQLHLGGRTYQVANEGPIAAALTLGATLHELGQSSRPAYYDAAKKTLAENPVIGAAEQIINPHDSSGKALAGNAASSFVPTALSDLAAQLDSQQRSKPAVKDYVANRIPGLRNTLPGTGRPSPSLPLLDPTGSKREY